MECPLAFPGERLGGVEGAKFNRRHRDFQSSLLLFSDIPPIATTVEKDEELSEAHDLVRQTVRALETGFDDIIRAVQIVGESVDADELREDLGFWRACSAESGKGYQDRINGHNRRWFEQEHHGEAETRVTELVAQKWREAVDSVRGLLPDA